jgi:hypothetical protein
MEWLLRYRPGPDPTDATGGRSVGREHRRPGENVVGILAPIDAMEARTATSQIRLVAPSHAAPPHRQISEVQESQGLRSSPRRPQCCLVSWPDTKTRCFRRSGRSGDAMEVRCRRYVQKRSIGRLLKRRLLGKTRQRRTRCRFCVGTRGSDKRTPIRARRGISPAVARKSTGRFADWSWPWLLSPCLCAMLRIG